jgi:hypothetical protein
MLLFVSAIEQSMRPEFYHIQQEKDIPLFMWSHTPFLHPKHRFLCRDIKYIKQNSIKIIHNIRHPPFKVFFQVDHWP